MFELNTITLFILHIFDVEYKLHAEIYALEKYAISFQYRSLLIDSIKIDILF